MEISPYRSNILPLYTTQKKISAKSAGQKQFQLGHFGTQIYNMSFYGLWSRKKPQNAPQTEEIPANTQNPQDLPEKTEEIPPKIPLALKDEMISYKLANTLHKLDEKSLIVIGNPQSEYMKTIVETQLNRDDSFLTSPKTIENVYVIDDRNPEPLIIAKGENEQFLIFGRSENLSKKKDYRIYPYSHAPVNLGEVIEKENGVRIRFEKTPDVKEADFFDEKFQTEPAIGQKHHIDGELHLKSQKPLEETSQKLDNKNKIPFRTFDDIAGMDKTIEKVKRKVLYPILYPEAFENSKNIGTILTGPPGTGKTLLALAIIGEAKKRRDKNVFCIQVDGSELARSHVGETEKKWRKVFDELRNNQPALLFVDEIDSVLGKRESGENFVHNNGVVSQFLTLTENLEKNNDKVWIIGATNRPENIDRAIKRNGRFGTLIEVLPPDEKGCFDILNLYLKDQKVSKNFDRKDFAAKLHKRGATGADIAAMVAEARENLYERCGIFKKMEDGTFENADLEGLEYTEEDFKPIKIH